MASIPVKSPVDMAGNPIENAALDPRTDDPATPVAGQVWFKDGRWKGHDGTNEKILALTDDTGSGVVANDFDAQSILAAIVDNTPVAQIIAEQNLYGRITGGDVGPLTVTQVLTMLGIEAGATADQNGLEIAALLAALTVPQSANINAGLLGGVQADQYATKAYADAVGTGSQLFADGPARLATTGPITLSGHQTIDGFLTVEDDRVLVKDQVTASTRGVFLAKSGAWQRTDDANTDTELSLAIISIEEGTINGGSSWRQTTAAPFTIDTDDINWAFAGATFIPSGFITNAMLAATDYVRERQFTIGDGVLTAIPLPHGLNNEDVTVHLRDRNTGEIDIHADPVVTDANTVTVTFGTAPTLNQYEALVRGRQL